MGFKPLPTSTREAGLSIANSLAAAIDAERQMPRAARSVRRSLGRLIRDAMRIREAIGRFNPEQ
jgi:predicted lipid carrier protein YhbT